jgi:hypothetical protein
LQTKNIRFHEDLRVHEDSYFLALAMASTGNVRKIQATTYVWKWGNDSITRRNEGLYSFDSVPVFLKAIDLGLKQVEKMAPEQMQYKVVQLIAYQYFTTHTPQWLAPERTEYLRNTEKAFADMIKPYIKYYENAPAEFINQVYAVERNKHFQGIETELFNDWLNRITRKS